MTWKSIPGETPIDVSGLKVSGVTTRGQLSVVEAENIRKPIVKYLGGSLTRRTAKFDLSWMLKLHREMFADVWGWAGETRTTNLNLGVPWHQVTVRMQDLCDDLAYWQKHWPDIVEQAAHLHHRAVLMDDWGFVGPTFGPLSCYVHTYCCNFRIHGESNDRELWLDKYDDMIRWDGCYYGDMEVFVAGNNDRA